MVSVELRRLRSLDKKNRIALCNWPHHRIAYSKQTMCAFCNLMVNGGTNYRYRSYPSDKILTTVYVLMNYVASMIMGNKKESVEAEAEEGTRPANLLLQ